MDQDLLRRFLTPDAIKVFSARVNPGLTRQTARGGTLRQLCGHMGRSPRWRGALVEEVSPKRQQGRFAAPLRFNKPEQSGEMPLWHPAPQALARAAFRIRAAGNTPTWPRSPDMRHRHQTPAEVDGRSFPGQVRHSAGLAVRTATWPRAEERHSLPPPWRDRRRRP